jgi:hypothetical protein
VHVIGQPGKLDAITCQPRMSGLYTIEEAHTFFGGHFRTAPLGLVEKHLGGGKFHMI